MTTADGTVTGEIDPRRRPSEFFVPVAPPEEAIRPADDRRIWRPEEAAAERDRQRDPPSRSLAGVSRTTRTSRRRRRDLLDHWRDEDRERRLFFCQIEAAETAIYLTEAAEKIGDTKALNVIRDENAAHNGGLPRFAFKMATGSGKTVLMAMLIAWQALNKAANPQDRRFSDQFLIVTPGITIRDRLRVLYPERPRQLLPGHWTSSRPNSSTASRQATILVTNFHAFLRRDKIQAASLTKKVLDGLRETTSASRKRRPRWSAASAASSATRRTSSCSTTRPTTATRRRRRRRPRKAPSTPTSGRWPSKDLEEARVWLSGVQAVRDKLGVRVGLRLSARRRSSSRARATPKGTLFPWVVSDFGLMDAIESGIVKIPRVPVSDDSMTGEGPMYRDLWLRVRDALPQEGHQGHADRRDAGNPQGARRRPAHACTPTTSGATPPGRTRGHGHAARVHRRVLEHGDLEARQRLDRRLGEELPDGSKVVVPGNLALFSNEQDGRLRDRPNTILVDSAQLDRGDALDPAFRKAAAAEIERFKHEYVTRFPGRSADDITDEDILREVMNTVGKRGRLGEHVRCVVSVAMLTEGWDANTVTHILGIRAFGTQLLCEQVVGRALRRASLRRRRGRPVRARVRRGLRRPVQLPVGGRHGQGQGRQSRPRGSRAARTLRPPDRVPAAHRLPLRDADRPPRGDLRRRLDPAALDGGHRDQDRPRPDRRRTRHPHGRPQRRSA